MNPLYQQIMGGAMGTPLASPTFNPLQRMRMVMNAMQNPAAFIKQKFPDIPDQYMNDPNLIMQYLQRTRGISDQDIQNVRNEVGSFPK